MKAIVLTAPDSAATVDVPEPLDRRGALVQLEQAGICGTDIKILHGDIPVDYPRLMGHEFVGRVVRPGPEGLHPIGTRVLVDPAVACGSCRQCRADLPNLCPNGALMGRDEEGVFAERIVVDERRLHPVPEAVSPAEAALLQVLGTCVHAQSQVPIAPPDAAVVIGLGVAGLLHVQLLRARGIRRIVGVSRSVPKRDLGIASGASAAAPPQDAEAVVHDSTRGEGATLVIEAVGTVETLAQAIRIAAPGGTVLVFGTITSSAAEQLPFYQLYYKELRLVNPRAALPRDYDRAIDLVAGRYLEVAPLWSGSHPLDEAAAAFREVAWAPGALKVTFSA